VHRVDDTEHRRIRRHDTEQVGLAAQHGDVGQTVAAIGERHRQLGPHDAGIVRRTATTGV
jgi:hypothetical protein